MFSREASLHRVLQTVEYTETWIISSCFFSQPQDTFLSFVVLCIKNNHLGPIICILFSLDLRRENCCYWPNELPFPTISTKEVSLLFSQTFLYQLSLASVPKPGKHLHGSTEAGWRTVLFCSFCFSSNRDRACYFLDNMKFEVVSYFCLNGDFVCITVVPY